MSLCYFFLYTHEQQVKIHCRTYKSVRIRYETIYLCFLNILQLILCILEIFQFVTHVQTTDLLLQANAARFWTYLTGLLVSEEDLSVDIPDADPFFGKYGPSFELTLTPGRRPNLNSSEILNDLLEEAFSK